MFYHGVFKMKYTLLLIATVIGLLFMTMPALAQKEDIRIVGTIYADMNSDGLKDDSELGLGNLPIELYSDIGSDPLDTVYADSYGDYEFLVAPGRYRVRFGSDAPESGFTEVIDVTNGSDALGVLIGVSPDSFGGPTAVTHVDSKTGLPLTNILLGSLSLLVLIAGLFIARKRGLI